MFWIDGMNSRQRKITFYFDSLKNPVYLVLKNNK